jgi:hypothetical protein
MKKKISLANSLRTLCKNPETRKKYITVVVIIIIIIIIVVVIKHVGRVTKATIRFVMPVSPSVRDSSSPTGQIFVKCYSKAFIKLGRGN